MPACGQALRAQAPLEASLYHLSAAGGPGQGGQASGPGRLRALLPGPAGRCHPGLCLGKSLTSPASLGACDRPQRGWPRGHAVAGAAGCAMCPLELGQGPCEGLPGRRLWTVGRAEGQSRHPGPWGCVLSRQAVCGSGVCTGCGVLPAGGTWMCRAGRAWCWWSRAFGGGLVLSCHSAQVGCPHGI